MRFMKGGGGGGTQVVKQSSLPEFAEPYAERLFARAEGESNQPYATFGGQRLADFSPDEATAQAMGRGFAFRGTPGQLDQASNLLMGATPGSGINFRDFQSGIDSGQFMRGPSQYTSQFDVGPYQRMGFEEGVQSFMNPYQQGVVDIAKREAIRDSEIAGQGIASRATQSGGLGGYREGIIQAERERNLGQRLDDIQVKGSDLAFRQAVDQLGKERDLGLKEAGLQEQFRQRQEDLMQRGQLADIQAGKLGLGAEQVDLGAGRLGLQAADLDTRSRLGLARGLEDVSGAIDQDALSRIGLLEDIGSKQRALDQASLDIGYQDFINQRDFSKNQLGFLSNLLYGSAPLTTDSRVSTFESQPGLFSNLVGTGLMGAGLMREDGRS